MISSTNPRRAGEVICKALGLDPSKLLIQEIHIDIDCYDAPQITVRFVLQTADGKMVVQEGGEGLEAALARFELVLIEPEEPIDDQPQE